MNDLFGALDAKLTLMLGGRSFFMAQTATPPQYLVGKTFFFTAGPATYAPRVPGYINIGTGGASVARPYNHAQFTGAITPISVIQVATASVASGGSNYHVGDIIPVPGGTLYAVSASVGATLKVTSVNSGGGITGLAIVNPGFYKTSPGPQVGYYNNYPQHLDVYINLTYTTTIGFYDETNKVAYVMPVAASAYSGLPTENLVGFFEWSLAAHSILRQGPNDKSPVRYYLQELPSASYGNPMPMPEKHFKFALAEIILEGVLSVTIEKTWDKYSCFRLHNLNSKPATVTFADGGYTVRLGPFQCATVRRDWDTKAGRCTNYRPGFNYFFKYEGGDPRLYWFFPTTGGNIGFGGRAANSMQANNLVNAALLFDWLLFFQRTVDGTSTFAGWIEDTTVQCDIYPLLKNLYGDPSNNATLVGDLLHHRGDIVILRKPKKIYQLAHALVQNGGKGYAVGNILYPSGGTAIQPSQVQVSSVDGQGGIMSVAVSFGGGYVFPVGLPPSAYNIPSGGSGSGAVLNLQFNVVANNISGIYGTKDKVTFNGYATIAADFAAKQLAVAENSVGDLVISNTDPYNDVYLFPISTNLFKSGETLPTYVDLTGTNQFTIENAIFESEPEQPYLDAFTLSSSAPSLLAQPVATTTVTAKVWYDIYDVRYLPAGIQNWDSTRIYNAGEWAIDPPANNFAFQALQRSQGVQPSSNGNLWLMVAQDLAPQYTANDWYYAPHPVIGAPQTTLNWNTGNYKLTGANVKDGGSAYAAGDGFTPDGGTGIPAQLEATAVAAGGRITGIKIISPGGYSSPPTSPNAVVGGSGIGALINLTFANFPIFHGVHKKTVADLLTLDWWGDPAYPGQNSNWVAITNRKLMLTPQGLVLTFTETDSPLPGDSYSQPASLPTWASGKRGLPRNRQLRFRLHGWGYCGVASSGANPAIPPSGRTGIFSPTRGRQEAIGSYPGRIHGAQRRGFFNGRMGIWRANRHCNVDPDRPDQIAKRQPVLEIAWGRHLDVCLSADHQPSGRIGQPGGDRHHWHVRPAGDGDGVGGGNV